MNVQVKGIASFCFSVGFTVLLLIIAFRTSTHYLNAIQEIKIEYECKDNILRTINHGQSGDYYLIELDENNDPVSCEMKK